jgi:DNA-binding LacI/PurR family transcriptional regulator
VCDHPVDLDQRVAHLIGCDTNGRSAVIAAERRDAILRELRLRGTLRVAEFAARLGISPVTLRRDLQVLEEVGQLTRVHGGATLTHQLDRTQQPILRENLRLAASFGVAPRSDQDGFLATIGMIAPTRQYYYAPTILGATTAARLAGVRLILAISEYNDVEERRLLERMIRVGVDGILITPAKSELTGTVLRTMIEESPHPITVVERRWEFPTRTRIVDSVRSDHLHGAEIAVEHLAELGHRSIGLWSYENPHVDEIWSGFDHAVTRLGLRAHEPEFDYGHPDWNSVSPITNVRRYLGEAVAAGVTALIVHPDQLALQVVEAAVDRGMRVPEDLSVIAYDDEIAGLAETPLTAIAPPKHAIGFAAIDICLRSIAHAGPTADNFPAQRLRLLPVLRVRDSTGPAPRRRRRQHEIADGSRTGAGVQDKASRWPPYGNVLSPTPSVTGGP